MTLELTLVLVCGESFTKRTMGERTDWVRSPKSIIPSKAVSLAHLPAMSRGGESAATRGLVVPWVDFLSVLMLLQF